MTNTAIINNKANTDLRPINNPYKRKEINVPKVSLSPAATDCYFTKHKSWGSGLRQPPPTHEVCFEKKAKGEFNKDFNHNERTCELHNETEVLHGDHGVFLCRNQDKLFLIVPIEDEWGVPDVEATLRDAASVPDAEVVSAQEFLQKKKTPTF